MSAITHFVLQTPVTNMMSWRGYLICKMQLDEIDIETCGFSSRNLNILKLMAENKKYFRNKFQNDKENWLADHIYQ